MIPSFSITQFIPFAQALADLSGQIIRAHFRTPLTIEAKLDTSPVTLADRAVEQAIRKQITMIYPQHGIYGEEMGMINTQAEYVWVIDPIDGTKAFMTGKPLFGTLIALLYQGKPVLGVLDNPILRERWIGGYHVPATLNGQAVQVRSCPTIAHSTLYATTPDMFKGRDKDLFTAIHDKVRYPLYGGDCYAYGLLACGFVDLVVEASLSPYDYCALVPIIENAGGIMTDWTGQALGLHSDGRVIAAGDKQTYTQALKILNSSSEL